MSIFKTSLSGWGNFPVGMAYVSRPEKYQQLKTDGEKKTIARGLGRSYGDAALNTEQKVILMERLNRFLSFDPREGILHAEGGVSLQEILDVFVPRGWFLPVTPGTKFVTLGGCFAADVHGKNHHTDGSFCQHVLEIELILANGARRKCSPVKDPDLFWATAGGMGLTGFISEVILQLHPISSAYMSVKHHPAADFDAVFNLLNDPSADEKYSVAWIDCLATGKDFGRSILMTGRHAEKEELPRKIKKPLDFKPSPPHSIPFYFPSFALNSWTVKTFNELYYRVQSKQKERFFEDYDRYFYPLDAVSGWNRIYGKRGFLQYQAVIPTAQAREGLRVLLEKLSSSKRPSFLAVLKRFGNESPGFLSFPREGYTLALDIPISDPKVFSFLNQLDEIVLKYGGRLYLAKDARMSPSTFRAMYPRFSQWQQVKLQVDPSEAFSSDLSRRLQMERRE